MAAFELYFTDLTLEAQTALLEAAHISGPDEANWETIPVTVLEFDERQDEDEV